MMEETEELSIDVSNIFKSIQTACDELTQRGQEYLLVTADPVSQSCMKIGSDKGRQFLDVNSEVVINFFSYCFGAELLVDDASNITPTNASHTDIDTPPPTGIHTDLGIQPQIDTQADIPENVQSEIQQTETLTDIHENVQSEIGPQIDTQTDIPENVQSEIRSQIDTQSNIPENVQSEIQQTDTPKNVQSEMETGKENSNARLNRNELLSSRTDLSNNLNEVPNTDLSENSEVKISVDVNEDMVNSPEFMSTEDTYSVNEMNDTLKTNDNVKGHLDTNISSEENKDNQLLSDSEIDSPLLSNQDQLRTDIESSTVIKEPAVLQLCTDKGMTTISSEHAEVQMIEVKVINTGQDSKNIPDSELQDKEIIFNPSKDVQLSENDNNTLLTVNAENSEIDRNSEMSKNSDTSQNTNTRKLNDKETAITDNQMNELNSAIEEAVNKINETPKITAKSINKKCQLDEESETNEAVSKIGAQKAKTNESPSKVSKKQTKVKESPSKISRQKAKPLNKSPEVNTSEKELQSSKPTCSICKATFSRIKSLKGHMLIIHELVVSVEELLNGTGNAQVMKESRQNKVTCCDKLTTKTPRKRKQKVVSETQEEDTDIVSEANFEVDPEYKFDPEKDLVEEENKSVDSVASGEIAEEKPKTKKRKNATGGKNLKNKKIKIEKDDSLNIESTKSNDDNDKQEANEGVIVLEENHDENVPKRVKSKEKSEDKAYCDICKKHFQRELNLTIHNIRYHPSKIMQEFGTEVPQNVTIKQEVDNYDEYEPYNQETEYVDTVNESQQENIDAFEPVEEDDPNNLDTILDPRDRLNEIMENDKIRQHINIAEKENKLLISCKYCDFSCNEFHQVMVHIARVHSNLSADLDIMMSCFYGINMYNKKCDECHMIFRSVASLWNHITEEHSVDAETNSKRKRLRHLIKKYKSKKSMVTCDICQEKFRSIRALNLHMATHPEGGKLYNCPHCGQSFSTKPNLTRHFKHVHLGERRFQCDICGKSIKSKEALKYHRTTHEVEKPKLYQCHICQKSLRKKETLQIHLRSHEGIKPYICEFCGMTFSQNGNRNKHVQLIHNDVRNLECHKCGKSFKLPEHLNRHVKMHLIREGEIQPDKTFSCEYEGCGACYLTSAQLKVHTMSKHTFERPFMCETCGKGFTTKDKMTRHALTHLVGEHECDICQKKFPSKISLSMHYKNHTGNVDIENEFAPHDNYQTVIIPQEHGAPIKVQLAHSEPINTIDSLKPDEPNDDDQTYYIQTTKPDEGEGHTVQVEDNTILVDPSILESVLGATSEDQTVYYYVTDS